MAALLTLRRAIYLRFPAGRDRRAWLSWLARRAGERRIEVREFTDLCDALGADPGELVNRVRRR